MFPPRQQQDYERFFKSRETTGTSGTFPEICLWKSAVLSVKRSDCYWKDSLYISSVHEVRFIHHHKATGLRSLEHLKHLSLQCVSIVQMVPMCSLSTPQTPRDLFWGDIRIPNIRAGKLSSFISYRSYFMLILKYQYSKMSDNICLLDYQYMSIQKPCAMQA